MSILYGGGWRAGGTSTFTLPLLLPLLLLLLLLLLLRATALKEKQEAHEAREIAEREILEFEEAKADAERERAEAQEAKGVRTLYIALSFRRPVSAWGPSHRFMTTTWF